MNELLKDIIHAERAIISLKKQLEMLNLLKTTVQRRIKNLAYNLTMGDNILDKDCFRMADALTEYQETCEQIAEVMQDLAIAESDLESLQEMLNSEN